MIVVKNLNLSFGSHQVLQDVSCVLPSHELAVVLGPSGCGKSSLLKCIAGIYPCQSDGLFVKRKRLEDIPITPSSLEATSWIGFVPQDDVLHTQLTVEKVLYYYARLQMSSSKEDAEVEKKVDQVCQLFELEEHRTKRVSKLSGGQRKRVSIGMEVLGNPPVLMLDEPTAGLDPALEEATMKLLRRLANAGKTIVASTHILDNIHIADMCMVLVDGHLVFVGPPKMVCSHFGISDLRDLYKVLAKASVSHLVSKFRASSQYKKNVVAPLSRLL